MAEKTRNKEGTDPFAPFEDWLKDGPATKEGEWPEFWGDWSDWDDDEELSKIQQGIVAVNAARLLDRDAWQAHVDAFEKAIHTVSTDEEKTARRAQYEIRFDRHDFGDKPDGWNFSALPLPCSVSFHGARFGDGNVSFQEVQFGDGVVRFHGARFGDGNVLFQKAQFGKGAVLFNGAQFGDGDVSFHGARFGEGNVSFDEVQFGTGHVSFGRVQFCDGNVSFHQTWFGVGDVSFNRAQFGDGNVYLQSAQFGKGTVRFEGTQFGKGTVLFMPEKLEGTSLSALEVTVEGNLAVKADFPCRADFCRLKVFETADFSGCIFAEVPDFRDAKFDRPPEVANMNVPSPEMIWARRDEDGKLLFRNPPWRVAQNEADVAKLRKLKAMALAANDHEMDGDFFAKEMLAKRGVETTSWFGLFFNALYYWLSNFGQSYLRPLAWLCFSFLSFTLIYIYTIGFKAEPWTRLDFSWKLSALSTLPFAGGLFRISRSPTDHKSGFQQSYDRMGEAGVDVDWVIFLSVVQSFLDAILLFLMLLALRNKFRLK